MPFFKPGVNVENLAFTMKLFTCERLGGKGIENIVLWCHGRHRPLEPGSLQVFTENIFKVPVWTTLYFYAPHDTVLLAGLNKFLDGCYEPLKIYVPNEECFNYSLAPMVRREQFGSEDYIKEKLLTHRMGLKTKKQLNPSRLYDIASVLNPCRLTSMLDCLEIKNRPYRRVHCLFCRNEGLDAHSYNPALVTPPNVYPGDLGRWVMPDIEMVDLSDVGDGSR